MVRSGQKSSLSSAAGFNFAYAVLGILFLLTIGATITFYDSTASFRDGSSWTPVVFLIGVCVSLLIFGITYREATARAALQRKTLDLMDAQRENEKLLAAEQASRIAAEHANQAKDQFLELVSHELRTPLNAIAGWNRILKTPGISEETRETAIRKIDKNLRIQTAIVEELLSFSDVMSMDENALKRYVRMRDVFEDAISTVKVAATEKGVALTQHDLLDGERVLGDFPRLKTAMVNVLDNAVKFTPRGGNIEARAFEADGCVKCVVSDNGLGMSSETLRHIFESYRQSEQISTRRFGGLGLGLTIAEHIVRMHNGTIEANSSGVGGGSTFVISIPSSNIAAGASNRYIGQSH